MVLILIRSKNILIVVFKVFFVMIEVIYNCVWNFKNNKDVIVVVCGIDYNIDYCVLLFRCI